MSSSTIVADDAFAQELVVAVLERIFELSPTERTRQAAGRLVEAEWSCVTLSGSWAHRLGAASPAELQAAYDRVLGLVDRWFTLEDPARLNPARRSTWLRDHLDGQLVSARVDRVDVSRGGAVRLVGYTVARAPLDPRRDENAARLVSAAVLARRLHGCEPVHLRLVCLGGGELLTRRMDAADLKAAQRRLVAVRRSGAVAA